MAEIDIFIVMSPSATKRSVNENVDGVKTLDKRKDIRTLAEFKFPSVTFLSICSLFHILAQLKNLAFSHIYLTGFCLSIICLPSSVVLFIYYGEWTQLGLLEGKKISF